MLASAIGEGGRKVGRLETVWSMSDMRRMRREAWAHDPVLNTIKVRGWLDGGTNCYLLIISVVSSSPHGSVHAEVLRC